MANRASNLTDNEGALLGLVARVEPVTAYQIAKIYEQSPVSSYKTSTGKLYPLIRRLRGLGLLEARPVEGDARGTDLLVCTDAGREAIRNWMLRSKPGRALLDDPLRTMVQSFDLLSREEQLDWILDAKASLMAKLAELQEYEREVAIPFKDFVLDNAFSSLRARMDWLDRMLLQVSRHGSAAAEAANSQPG